MGTRSGQCGPKVPGRLAFPVPQILEFIAFRDSGKFFQRFSRDFPGVFLESPRTDPGNSHSLLEFSDQCARVCQNYPLAIYPVVAPRRLQVGKKSWRVGVYVVALLSLLDASRVILPSPGRVAKALAIYRIDKPRNPENTRKTGKEETWRKQR